MATLPEIANDLAAQSDLINKRGFIVSSLRRSLRRAADALRQAAIDLQDRDREIRALKATITCLEEDAEREAQKLEAYRNGDNLHGE